MILTLGRSRFESIEVQSIDSGEGRRKILVIDRFQMSHKHQRVGRITHPATHCSRIDVVLFCSIYCEEPYNKAACFDEFGAAESQLRRACFNVQQTRFGVSSFIDCPVLYLLFGLSTGIHHELVG